MKNNYFLKYLFLLAVGISSSVLFGQTTYTFTNCTQTGAQGPTQVQVDAAYSATNLNGMVTINTQGIQEWVVPVTGNYSIDVFGAQGGTGGGNAGGLGANMTGEFALTAGQMIQVIAGQIGVLNAGSGANDGGSGGGGSFVVDMATVNPMIVAGAGGGGGSSSAGVDAVTTESGTDGSGASSGLGGLNGGGGGAGLNGIAGNGMTPGGDGSSCSYGAGGAGFFSRGGYNCAGAAPLIAGFDFASGAAGGTGHVAYGGTDGGFGGGAGSGHRSSGGGGYSGGGGNGNTEGGGAGGSFNSGTNQTNTAGVNSGDGYVIFTQLCSDSPSAFSADACESYTVPSGNDTYVTSGVYNDTIANATGCDSIMTITVTITTLDLNTTTTDFTIMADQASGTYQWINCIDNLPIAGATNQSFTADANGDYAVIISDGPCSDTSACATIAGVGISEVNNLGVSLYPNPSNGQFYVSSTSNDISVKIYSIDGKVVIDNLMITKSNQFIDLVNIEKGVYFVEFTNDEKKDVIQLIIE
jgi:hypothetical protein